MLDLQEFPTTLTNPFLPDGEMYVQRSTMAHPGLNLWPGCQPYVGGAPVNLRIGVILAGLFVLIAVSGIIWVGKVLPSPQSVQVAADDACDLIREMTEWDKPRPLRTEGDAETVRYITERLQEAYARGVGTEEESLDQIRTGDRFAGIYHIDLGGCDVRYALLHYGAPDAPPGGQQGYSSEWSKKFDLTHPAPIQAIIVTKKAAN